MTSSITETPLLDKDYNSLSVEEQNEYLKDILTGLLQSSALSEEAEATDALEVFEDYEWTPKAGIDVSVFNELRMKGEGGKINESELNQFMDMVSDAGQHHLYFLIRKGNHIIYQIADIG